MKTDLKNYSLHPTDKELADYIDNNLKPKAREEILEHLIYCDECTEIVADVIKKKSTKTSEEDTFEPVNDIEYKIKSNSWFNNEKVKAIVLSVAVALLVVLILPEDNAKFKSATVADAKDIVIDKSIAKIKASMNLNYLKELDTFKKAKEYLKAKDYNSAREFYNMALIDIEKSTLDNIEKYKQSIVVNYNILLLSKEEGDKESENEYIDKLKDDIRRLSKEEGTIDK